MSYIYKVFEHLEQLWMGIWQHTHTVATTEVSPDLGELAEILDNVVGGIWSQLIFRWNLLEAGFFLRELMTKVYVSSMDGEHW